MRPPTTGRVAKLIRTATRASIVVILLYATLSAVRVYARRYYLFLPDYVRWTFTPSPTTSGLKHVFVLVTDHFEPDSDPVRTRRWAQRYRALAARHRDSSGRAPQHTWFYPGEQFQPEVLGILRDMTQEGLGEVEMHLHHENDTEATLEAKLATAIAQFQDFGFLKTTDGQTRFAFVHGNFDLDNSIGPGMCGVSTELRLLRRLGCFADFSFPSVYRESQPDIVNSIYAAADDASPKSYNRRLPLSALADGTGDLMMFQGPLVFAPTLNVRRLFLDLDDGNLHAAMPPSPDRVERWLRAAVHVGGRPDWIFVKLWAHGVSSPGDEEATTGAGFDATLTHLERTYNDGTRYALHYITAREAYNLARAAAEGAIGEPDAYLDRYVGAYVTGSRRPAAPLDVAIR
jgi:hypothetical protein